MASFKAAFRGAMLSICLIAGCAPMGGPQSSRSALTQPLPLPPARSFAATQVTPPQRSNGEMAQDFIELAFRLESGRRLPVLTRYATPLGVRLTGPVPATAAADLGRLLARLRAEAQIDIRYVASGPAAITIEFLPRGKLQRLVPEAACFVAPRVSSWQDYKRARRSSVVDWTTLTSRETAAIFIPADAAPQEIRDCLHEELAQALGPLNDLYRLPDSVFNDDNTHGILTGFDMLMLRAFYDPDLANGMSEGAVAARIPAVLARLNPAGERPGPMVRPTPQAYVSAIQKALGPRSGGAERRSAALAALTIAEREGWNDVRTGFAWLAIGRLTLGTDPAAAHYAFSAASFIYHSRPELALQSAHADLQLAAFALSRGHPEDAIQLANGALPLAATGENAALMASLMMIKAEALEVTGRASEASQVRLDSLGWARYGFGSDAEVRDRLESVAALAETATTRAE